MRTTTTAAMFRVLLTVLCGVWLTGAAAAQSHQIREAQGRLETLGHSPGLADGLMGPQTREALRAFQRKTGLPVTGELDWETQLALSANVRKLDDPVPAPKPRSAPVPEVTISSLTAPGLDEIRSSEPGSSESAVMAEATVAPLTVSETRPPVPIEPLTRLPDPLDKGTDIAPVVADHNSALVPIGAAIVLGLAATATWIVLLLWWRRSRRADVAARDQ